MTTKTILVRRDNGEESYELLDYDPTYKRALVYYLQPVWITLPLDEAWVRERFKPKKVTSDA